MLIKSNNRTEAIRAVINIWLKDPSLYCDRCDSLYKPNLMPCCSDPLIIDNLTAMQMTMDETREIRETNLNEFGSNKAKNFRYAIKIPQRLLTALDNYFKTYGEKGVFRDKNDLRSFMKNFRQLTTAVKV